MADQFRVIWEFDPGEARALPANCTVGPELCVALLPDQDDVVSFEALPGVKFVVSAREFEFVRASALPLRVHIHLARAR